MDSPEELTTDDDWFVAARVTFNIKVLVLRNPFGGKAVLPVSPSIYIHNGV